MRKAFKRFISLALVLSMTVSMVMTCAMADEAGTTVTVDTAQALQTALESTEYSGKVVVQLTADITLTADTLITSLGPDDVTIDGQGQYTLSAPSGDAGAYTLFSLSSLNGKTLTFENLTIDAGNQQLLSLTNGTDTALRFSGVTLNNLYGASVNSGGISVSGKASGNDITCHVTLADTAVSGTGTLLSIRYASLSAADSSFTASALEGGAVICLRNNAGEYYRCTASLFNSAVSWTDESADETGSLFNGIYVGTYWSLTLDGGCAVTGTATYTPEETYTGSDIGYAAIFAAATSSQLTLNDCTVSNSDGSDAFIRLVYTAALLQTDGSIKGQPLVLLPAGAEILLTGSLEAPLSYSFYSATAASGAVTVKQNAAAISGSDPVVAAGSGYELTGADLALLIYNDAASPRTLTLEDNTAVLYRSALTEDMVSLPGADTSGESPVITASWDASSVTPAVQVKSGETLVDESNYTVIYTGSAIPSTAKAGELLDAAVTVTGQDDLLADSVTLSYQILISDYIDLGAEDAPASASVSYQDGAYTIAVTYNGETLTQDTDYTVSYNIDTDKYVTTVTISGKGSYGGSITLTVDILGQQSAVAYVSSEEELTAALAAGASKIFLAGDIQVDEPVEIGHAVTINGQGHTLSAGALPTTADGSADSGKTAALLCVGEEGALTLTNITVDGSGQTRCLYTAGTVTLTGGAVLTGGGLDGSGTSERGLAVYIDKTGTLTVADAEIRDITDYPYVPVIVNLGILNIQEGAYLTRLLSYYSAILNKGALNWSGGTFDVNASGYYSNNSYSGDNAGTVIENQGTFHMTGGLLNGLLLNGSGGYSSTRATAYFGAVHNAAGAVFTMSGGTIQGFEADGEYNSMGATYYPYGGGGVYNNGTFTMSGDALIANNISETGGGVYNAGVFYFEGGTISGNSAYFGGGVYNDSARMLVKNGETLSAAEFYMTGGTLSGNKLLSSTITCATTDSMGAQLDKLNISAGGSALYVSGGSTAVISGGTIEGDKTARVSVVGADGNTADESVSVGIAVVPASYSSAGATGSAFTATNAVSASLTVTGSPDINVGILLTDYGSSVLSANLTNLNADGFDGSDTSTYEYTITSTEATETSLSSYLALDGALETTLSVTALTVSVSSISLTNLTSIAGYNISTSISTVQMFLNRDGEVLAVYNEGVEADESDEALFALSSDSGLYLTEDEDGNGVWVICTHSELEYVEAQAATCTEAGHTGYYQCAGCGAMFADADASAELTGEDITVAATGHTWAVVAATEAGLTAGVQCSVCGEWLIEQTATGAAFLFDDVQDASQYYYNAVYWAYDLEITSGTSATTFSPSQGCTRAQFVTFLYALAKATGADTSVTATGTAFSDVSSGDWYYTAVLWATEKGITAGTSTTTFTPNRTITRREAIAMLYAYEKMANGAPDVTVSNPFSDVDASDYAYTAILWAYEQGITSGTSAATFSPGQTCTRAMMVTYLYQYAG